QVPIRRMRSIFPLLSGTRKLLDRLVALLASVEPEASPGYEAWGLARIARTVEVLKRWVAPKSRVLDLGSGAHFSYLVSASLPDIEWCPTDVTDDSVIFTNWETGQPVYAYRPIKLLLDEGRVHLPQEGKLDVVTLFEVIEHLPWNPCALLGSINESLVDGGLCIISTPNLSCRAAVLRLLRGGSPHQTPLLGNNLWYHKKEFTPWELKQALGWAGLTIESLGTSDVCLSDLTGWRGAIHELSWLTAASLTLSAIEIRNRLLYSGSTMFVVARKARHCDWTKPQISL
ncbi:MAG TPA: methyltransferase domain-containing protein, partial [Gemmataceae bacterium]|nr:methyltransferase domain-containing protein [Gemmataceae bacterium]